MRMINRENRMAESLARTMMLGALLAVSATFGIAQTAVSGANFSAPPLKIGSGDMLEMKVYGQPDLSGRFRVDEKGNVTLPLIGPVHVEDQTAEEAGVQIEKRYVEAEILQSVKSHTSIFIAEYATQGVTINGEVRSPGVYPALGVHTVDDLITSAGGILSTAAAEVIITHKNAPDNPVTVSYNPLSLTPVVPRVQVLPGDSLMVPRAGIVYVLGNVERSGGYVLDGRRALTIEAVMALAGGAGHASALKRVQLVRTEKSGEKVQMIIPVNLIYKGKAPDVVLRDGDIVYVPTSRGRLVTEQAINSALGIGTQITIYRTAVQR
jgi:polysaccharide export outer membrane protein